MRNSVKENLSNKNILNNSYGKGNVVIIGIAVAVVIIAVVAYWYINGRPSSGEEILPANTRGIGSAEDLIKISQNPGGNYKLTRDIDLSKYNSWKPISSFRGKLDGGGHRIVNLKINSPLENNVGLFGSVEAGALIENLNLENVDIIANDYVGAFAGSCNGSIKNCTATGSIKKSGRYVGGIFGNFEGNAEKTKSMVNVNGSQYVGGLVGQASGGTITRCFAKGNGITIIGNNDCVGGLVGLIQPFKDLQITESCSSVDVNGTKRVGGLVGWINSANSMYSLDINNCYADGNISRCEESAGGFIGMLTSSGGVSTSLSFNYTTCKPPKNCKEIGGFIGTISQNSTPSVRYCYWEREEFAEQFLSENGVGYSDNSTIAFDSLSPDDIKNQSSFIGWETVIKNWKFDTINAPTLNWE